MCFEWSICPAEIKPDVTFLRFLFAGSQEKQIIRNAFKSWMDNTCITFEEVDTNTDVTENHILLTAEGTGFLLQLNVPLEKECAQICSEITSKFWKHMAQLEDPWICHDFFVQQVKVPRYTILLVVQMHPWNANANV